MLVFGTLQRLVACEFHGSDWTSDKQISRTFQGSFKDKLQFSRTKIYLIGILLPNPTLLITLLRLKHVLESFTIFTSSAIVAHTFLNYFPQQDFAKWLGISATRLRKMTGYDLQLHLRYRNSIWNKGTEIKYCSCTKIFLRYPWVLQVLLLAPTMSQIFLDKII